MLKLYSNMTNPKEEENQPEEDEQNLDLKAKMNE